MEKLYQNKKWLEHYYLIEKLSTTQIGKICGVYSMTIYRWLMRHGIKVRTKSESQIGALNHMFGKSIPEERKKILSERWKGKKNPSWSGKQKTTLRKEAWAVWEKYYGPIPKGQILHHIDGDYANNDISNLMLTTYSEHSHIHGGYLNKNFIEGGKATRFQRRDR